MTDPNAKTILIVDDDEGQRELLSCIVAGMGQRAATASSGPEALKLMETLTPDAVLLDLMLPAMGGYEVLRELQARGAGDVPVVIVTARSLDPRAADALKFEPNVKDVMSKPINPSRLSVRLHALLGTAPQVI